MPKERRKFKGGVSRNAEKQARKPQYGHLNLPKGLQVFKEEPRSRVDIDILPYTVTDEAHMDRDEEYGIAVPGELWYKKPYLLHRDMGPNGDKLVCPGTKKKPCPICEHRAQLLKDGAEWDDDAVKSLKPTLRNLYAIKVKDGKTDEIQLWDISQFLFQDKLNEEVQENEDNESFPDLEDGRTLRVRFAEESFGKNKYASTSRIDFREREKPYKDALLDEVPNLDDIIEVPSYATAEAIFFGGMTEGEAKEAGDDEGEDEAPVRTRGHKPSPKEDDDDEAPPQKKGKAKARDDDEDDEAPPRKAAVASPKKKEQEPDDDDDPPLAKPGKKPAPVEDDEDEAPKPKAKGEKAPEKAKEKAPEKATPKKDEKKSSGDCPHGHKFGKDCDEYDDCDKCKKYDDCIDAS